MFIVIDGNPVDGFNHTGPFVTADDAHFWADENLAGAEYWVVALDEPGE